MDKLSRTSQMGHRDDLSVDQLQGPTDPAALTLDAEINRMVHLSLYFITWLTNYELA
jgi:hypothetical protein